MEILQLLRHALGCLPMYWGISLLVVFVVALVDIAWSWLTKQDYPVMAFCSRWNLFLVPAFLVQFWFAAYAAQQVDLTVPTASPWYANAMHVAGVVSVLLSAAIFHGTYSVLLEVYESWRWSAGVAAATLLAYGLFLASPEAAEPIASVWTRALYVVGIVAVESALN